MAKILSTQEAFDFALNGVRAQNYLSSVDPVDKVSCLYRGGNGRKCSVGHCFPDSMYRKRMEHTDFTVLEKYPDLKLRFSEIDKLFLDTLQTIHDRLDDKEPLRKRRSEFEAGMRGLAADFKLQYRKL